jgi:hypothetical protein
MNTINYEIDRIPCNSLTPCQCALIELRKAMLEIRLLANKIRLNPWMKNCHNGDYLIGFLNGIHFSWATLLIFQTRDWYRFSEEAEAFSREADFLLGSYLEGH